MEHPFYFTEITESGDVSVRWNHLLKISMTLIEYGVYDFDGFCIGDIIEENGTGLGVVLGTGASKWFDLFVTFVEKKDPSTYKLLQIPANIDIMRATQEICSEPVEDIQYLKNLMEFV